MTLTRRALFRGAAALLVAPAIVRVASIMPVKAMPAEITGNVGGMGWIISQETLPADLIALLQSRMRDAREVMVQSMLRTVLETSNGKPIL